MSKLHSEVTSVNRACSKKHRFSYRHVLQNDQYVEHDVLKECEFVGFLRPTYEISKCLKLCLNHCIGEFFRCSL